MKIWVMYDNSRARLPVLVTDTAVELAKIAGVSVHSIRSTACRVKSGECTSGRYAVVDVDWEESDEVPQPEG